MNPPDHPGAPRTLELHCAGYPEVWVDGQPVPLKLRAGLSLLAYLVDSGRKAARARLAELLWPDTPGDVARARLRRLCHTVNGTLGVASLAGDADAVWIDERVVRASSDVARTRDAAMRLVAASAPTDVRATIEPLLAPTAHQVLAGFDPQSAAFDEWLDARRAEHERLLSRALGRAAETLLAQGHARMASDAAQVLVRLEPLADAGHVLLLEALGRLGESASLDAAYFACADLLRSELGIRPSAGIEAAYARARERLARADAAPGSLEHALPAIRFADTGDGSVAFLELPGPRAGAPTLIINFGLWSHVEVAWEEPRIRAVLARLATRFRVVLMDRRGVGLSERLARTHSVASNADDIDSVRRALGVDRVWLLGNAVGGMISIEYAVAHAPHVDGLLLYAVNARFTRSDDHPFGLSPAQLDAWRDQLESRWGHATSLEQFAPSLARNDEVRGWWARMLRQAASRNSLRSVMSAFSDGDVRDRLPQVRVPTLVVQRSGDRIVREGAARLLADGIPGAELVVLPGDDHLLWAGDAEAVLARIEAFVDRHADRGG